jgi:hypothetical protein
VNIEPIAPIAEFDYETELKEKKNYGCCDYILMLWDGL